MRTSTRLGSLLCCAFLPLSLFACAADSQEDQGNPDESPEMEASELTSRTIRLNPGQTSTFTLRQTTAGDVALSVDCHPPANPDDPGPVFKLSAPTLGTTAADPARAGFWARTGAVPAGSHTMTFANLAGPATCTIRAAAVPTAATCRASLSFRSPNTDHTHVRVGVTSNQAGWEAFPTSGNHWGAWSKWTTVYPKAIKPGFLLHTLEHGGLVFSYKCASNTSAECKDAETKLTAIASQIGPRVIVTPDPTQPEMFAIRGWRYGFSSSCLDNTSALQFSQAHYRQGREDTDANPPIPFDPTTTNVPCEDLMAAPDSCSR
ncbi:MAG: Xanthine/uracil/thiamine/ascorbate permease family protein [Labilithrix sp.]|nr:Xanthine/uracil/thiamine/ascorbate permease family protein [Labilithrix sp.]